MFLKFLLENSRFFNDSYSRLVQVRLFLSPFIINENQNYNETIKQRQNCFLNSNSLKENKNETKR